MKPEFYPQLVRLVRILVHSLLVGAEAHLEPLVQVLVLHRQQSILDQSDVVFDGILHEDVHNVVNGDVWDFNFGDNECIDEREALLDDTVIFRGVHLPGPTFDFLEGELRH